MFNRKITSAALVITVLVATFAISAPASANTSALKSCPELGRHTSFSGPKRTTFVYGGIPKRWLSPGGHYEYHQGTTLRASSQISGSVAADFWQVAHASVSGSVSKAVSVTTGETFSWTNTTKTTRWVQLGLRGYSQPFETFTVVRPCKITKLSRGHAVLVTREEWLNHS